MFLAIIVGTSVISFVQCAIDVAAAALGSRVGFALTVGGMVASFHLWMNLYKHPRKSIRFRIMSYSLQEKFQMGVEFIKLQKKGYNAVKVGRDLFIDFIRRANPEYISAVLKTRAGKSMFRLVGEPEKGRKGFIQYFQNDVVVIDQLGILARHLADELVSVSPDGKGQVFLAIWDRVWNEKKPQIMIQDAGRKKTQRRKKARRTRRKSVMKV